VGGPNEIALAHGQIFQDEQHKLSTESNFEAEESMTKKKHRMMSSDASQGVSP
jgi:hypothetical protein